MQPTVAVIASRIGSGFLWNHQHTIWKSLQAFLGSSAHCRLGKTLVRVESSSPFAHETGQDLSPFKIRSLLFVVTLELRDTDVVVRVELEVDVVDGTPVFLPQSQVMVLDVFIRSYWCKWDYPAFLEPCYELPDAICKNARTCVEVFVVNVDSVEVVFLDHCRQRRYGILNPGVCGFRNEKGVAVSDPVSAQADGKLDVWMSLLKRSDSWRSQMVGFPEDAELSVGARRVVFTRVVDCKGEDEVEFDFRVYGDVR